MIPYKDIECCPETNSTYAHTCRRRFTERSSVYVHIIFKKFGLYTFSINVFQFSYKENKHVHLKSGLLTQNMGVVEAQELQILLPGHQIHDNNDRTDFGNSDVEVITSHFKDICENSDVKIDDALTEWDVMKSNFDRRQDDAGQHKYEPYNVKYI